MNQDFIDWLNSADDGKNTSQGTNLLVAPINIADSQVLSGHQEHEENISPEAELKEDNSQQKIINETQNLQLEFNFDSDSEYKPESEKHEDNETLQGQSVNTTSKPESESEYTSPNQQDSTNSRSESEISNILQELRNLRKQVEELDTPQISYDEPPPQTWAESYSDSEIESELYEHYEQGIDFQEYNDRTPHGTNFTRRLQRILHERKERAAEEKLREEAQRNSHPYIAKSILLCLALIIALLFAFGVLFYMQKRVPDYINAVPEESRQEESEPYSQEINQERNHIQIEMTQNREGGTQPVINHESGLTHLTFEDYLREGNEAFNLGIYNSALKNFFRALELDDNDSRPYIGLAGAYRAKGLYFDAKRILDEAMMIFRKNPTIETALKILEGDSKHGTCKCKRSK